MFRTEMVRMQALRRMQCDPEKIRKGADRLEAVGIALTNQQRELLAK